MKDGRDADRRAEMPGIAAEGQEGVGGGTEQERVEDARIALGDGMEAVRQREDDMNIGIGRSSARRASSQRALARA